jgi:hypothetical protein
VHRPGDRDALARRQGSSCEGGQTTPAKVPDHLHEGITFLLYIYVLCIVLWYGVVVLCYVTTLYV